MFKKNVFSHGPEVRNQSVGRAAVYEACGRFLPCLSLLLVLPHPSAYSSMPPVSSSIVMWQLLLHISLCVLKGRQSYWIKSPPYSSLTSS